MQRAKRGEISFISLLTDPEADYKETEVLVGYDTSNVKQ